MPKAVILSDAEVEYLSDVMDFWVEGHEDATTQVMQDRTIESPETMLTLVNGMHNQFDQGVRLQSLLHEARQDHGS